MDTKKIIKIFKEKGYKVTSQRLAIYEFLLSRKDHPTAEQVYKELIKKYPTISLGTIYKTIHLLKELDLLQELGFDDGSTRYDPDMELHINIVCSKCGNIYDYKTKSIEKMWNTLISDIGIKPEGQRIDIYYECDECKQNEIG